jgi:hypothetical protein
MALLCAHVDTDTIQLLGRWRSDEMLRYLHIQAAPIMTRFSRLMVSSDANYDLIPGQEAATTIDRRTLTIGQSLLRSVENFAPTRAP